MIMTIEDDYDEDDYDDNAEDDYDDYYYFYKFDVHYLNACMSVLCVEECCLNE